MTIFQLECYYALAQSLNFTQTASQQYITQPALSRSISSLEKELGIKLVNRTTHTVSLTPAGICRRVPQNHKHLPGWRTECLDRLPKHCRTGTAGSPDRFL